MRLIAEIKNKSEFKRAMLYQSAEGCYLFLYDRVEDGPCIQDYLFEEINEAKDNCKTEQGINESEWSEIPDPMPGCQDDWIAPVRVKGRDSGHPEWGVFQKLENGNWIDIQG
jgi:biofilm protein TabA